MPIDAHERNRRSWNAASARHNLHKGDQAAFFRAGGDTLYPEDREVLGEVAGLRLLHLQCNCGQDSLSIARHLGAEVTGVDISDTAIDFARALSADSGIAARFERADLFDWCERPEAPRFEVVYTSYGAIGWLSDIARWGRAVAKVLEPCGRFSMVEFHPAFLSFGEDAFGHPGYDYMGGSPIHEPDGVGDYVGLSGDSFKMGHRADAALPEFDNPHPSTGYPWGLGETVTALLEAGLELLTIREYPYSNGWKPYPEMRDLPGGRKAAPEGSPELPMMFSITARKAG